jgi:hypothetical protein
MQFESIHARFLILKMNSHRGSLCSYSTLTQFRRSFRA